MTSWLPVSCWNNEYFYILTITMALSNKDKSKWVCLVLALSFFLSFFLLSLLKFSLNLQFSWTVRGCQMDRQCFPSTCLPQASLLHLESGQPCRRCSPRSQLLPAFPLLRSLYAYLFIYHLMLQHPAGFVVAAFHLQRH